MKQIMAIYRSGNSRICIISLLFAFLVIWTCSKTEQTEKSETRGTETNVQDTLQATEDQELEIFEDLESYAIISNEQVVELDSPLQTIAAKLEADTLRYATEDLTDCSGIFHRVLKAMKKQYPDFKYPEVEEYRDTRDLARWYYELDELVLVEDAIESAYLIKPGAVLFYGQRDSVYDDFTADDLFRPKTGINHVGVVVSVNKNEAGEVIDYELFHGHGKPGVTPASITNYHQRIPSRESYPPFGNGAEQWVAFAKLINVSAEVVVAD